MLLFSWSVDRSLRAGRSGFTLIEVLLASGLLLVLTTAFLALLDSTFTRARVVDERQSVSERLVIFKEYCNDRIRNSRIESLQCTPEMLVFVVPVTAATEEGQLNTVGNNEMTVWDELHQQRLSVKEVDGEFRAVEETYVRDDTDSEDWRLEKERVVWNFGVEGKLEFSLSQLPLVTVKCSTVLKRRGGDLPWQRELTLLIGNYR